MRIKAKILAVLCCALLIVAQGCSKPVDKQSGAAAAQPAKQTETNEMLGTWYIVGEGEDYKISATDYELYEEEVGAWTWKFYEDEYELTAPKEAFCRNYSISDKGFICSVDENGKPIDPEYRIVRSGDTVYVVEYWHKYNADTQMRDFSSGYDQEAKHSYYVLRRAQ